MKKNKKVIIIAFIAVAFAAGALIIRAKQKTTIETAYPERGTAITAVYATGTVEPAVMLPLAPQTTARLTNLYADEGDRVTKDQILAQFDDEELKKIHSELAAKTELAEKDHIRKAKLQKQGVVSLEALEKAQAELDMSRAALARVKTQIANLQLTAPADSTVIRRDGEVGELITAGQTVLWLACCTELRVTAEIDEEDIAVVKPEQKVVMRTDAFPEQIFEGLVDSITPKGDPIARSYRIRISLPEETGLMIGMTVEANIVISETKNALLIPSESLQGQNIWLANGGILKRHPVKTGARTSQRIEITDGLNEDDLVVLSPSPSFTEGLAVKTKPRRQEENR